jgi:hypothetical protein
MRLRRLLTAIALLVTLAIMAACSSSSAKKPTDTQTTSTGGTSAGGASTVASTPPSSRSVDPAARETADRLAVEAAWTKFWQVYAKITKVQATELVSSVDHVAVDPIRKEMIGGAKVAATAHRTDYGYVINHPYWQQSVGGMKTAVMGDCQDQSHYGSMSTTTGQKLTVGVAHDNMKASFVKGSDGLWRVQTIVYLKGVSC